MWTGVKVFGLVCVQCSLGDTADAVARSLFGLKYLTVASNIAPDIHVIGTQAGHLSDFREEQAMATTFDVKNFFPDRSTIASRSTRTISWFKIRLNWWQR